MILKNLSGKQVDIKDKATGKVSQIYKYCVRLPDGDTAQVYSGKYFADGDDIEFVPSVTKDGRLTLKVK